ncbi:MAG TPA: GFA family protein [Gammaproteobacteria bacterium]|nr:GFA family protein [Gammaproteobacteria bacterium]
MKYLTGSCLCGKVKIQIVDSFDFVGHCHCSECQKWSGSAFATGGLVDSDDFQITSGEEFVSYYHNSEETDLGFCNSCGSSLFSKKLKRGKHVVRLGILDDAPTQRPNVHIFAASKAPWFEITDQLDRFDTVP